MNALDTTNVCDTGIVFIGPIIGLPPSLMASFNFFKQQGVEEIRSSDMMLLLGYEEEEIPPEEFDIWLSLPENADLEAEAAAAKIMGRIH